MKRLYSNKLSLAIVGLSIAIIAITAIAEAFYVNIEEYFLIVNNEQLHFIAQPQAGYVLKIRDDIGSMYSTSRFLKSAGDVKISPVRGLGRKGIFVVYNEHSSVNNDKTIKALGVQTEVQYSAPLFSSNGETVAIIPEIVIRVKPGTEIEQIQALCETAGCTIIKQMEFTEQEYLIEVLGTDAEAVFVAGEELSQTPEVEWACPNTAFQPKLYGQAISSDFAQDGRLWADVHTQDANNIGVFPNDEYFPMQWHLHNTGQSGGTPGADINAPAAWEITTGDPNIVVAVIDTGVDSNHPDLKNNLVPGYDFWENDNSPDTATSIWIDAHGTVIAGLIAAEGNNNLGVVGVAYDSKIMPIRDGGESWDGFITEADEATAFRWAATQGADVVNFSTVLVQKLPILHSAVRDITLLGGIGREGKGCVVVFPAGNAGQPIQPQSTAAYPEVIAVGATDHNDNLAYWSNYGVGMDIVAPGGGGIETDDDDLWTRMSTDLLWTTDTVGTAGFSQFNSDPNLLDYTDKAGGTSMSCPIVVGVAALILSVEPNLTGEEVRHFLEQSARDLGDPGWDDYYGWGRIDARAALDMVLAKRADLNNDWKVDLEDLLVLIEFWGAIETSVDIAPATRRDGVVDEQDLDLMMCYWQTEIPELGLIAHWALDEIEGDIASDSANDNDGTVYGDPAWQPEGGMVDSALQLDGINDYVSTPVILDPAEGDFSVFAWIKGGAPGQVIISQTAGVNWLLADPSEGNLMTELRYVGPGRVYRPLLSQTLITDGKWHRVGFVWDGSHKTLYVDDVAVAEGAPDTLEGPDNGLYIGTGKNKEPGTYWSGLIDDVRIYNRAVSP